MNIKYGKTIKETTYIDSTPQEKDWVEYRDQVKNDSEELALFIRFQKETKNSPEAVFTREFVKSRAGNVNRYAVRKWEI
jgi:hypothetical protein